MMFCFAVDGEWVGEWKWSEHQWKDEIFYGVENSCCSSPNRFLRLRSNARFFHSRSHENSHLRGNLHLLFGNQAWICIYLHFYSHSSRATNEGCSFRSSLADKGDGKVSMLEILIMWFPFYCVFGLEQSKIAEGDTFGPVWRWRSSGRIHVLFFSLKKKF